MEPRLSERRESLWIVVSSPLIWSGHFLASYFTAAIWCAKFAGPDRSLLTARVAMMIYTVLALVSVFLIGRRGFRRHRVGAGRAPHDDDSPEDRHRFLGFATFLLSTLSAVAIIYSALAVTFIGSCY